MPPESRFLTISGRGVPATLPHATQRRIARRNIWADGRPPETCRPCAKTIGDGKAKIPTDMTDSHPLTSDLGRQAADDRCRPRIEKHAQSFRETTTCED